MEFQIESAIPMLASTPAVVRAMLSDLPEYCTAGGNSDEAWKPFDVVGHLIHGEETDWIPRARIILARGPNPAFEPYDRFRHRARNAGRSLASLLEEFARLRAANLELLQSWHLTEAELDLPGAHPGLGRVTLRQLLAAWVSTNYVIG